MAKVFGMPAFTSTNPDAKTQRGSINYGVADGFPGAEEHPVAHNPNYGDGAFAGGGVEYVEDTEPDANDRSDWLKKDWVELADYYGLDSSGTVADLQGRVNDHEATLEGEGEV